MIQSSSALHEPFFTSGHRWLNHRSRHCLPARPEVRRHARPARAPFFSAICAHLVLGLGPRLLEMPHLLADALARLGAWLELLQPEQRTAQPSNRRGPSRRHVVHGATGTRSRGDRRAAARRAGRDDASGRCGGRRRRGRRSGVCGDWDHRCVRALSVGRVGDVRANFEWLNLWRRLCIYCRRPECAPHVVVLSGEGCTPLKGFLPARGPQPHRTRTEGAHDNHTKEGTTGCQLPQQ